MTDKDHSNDITVHELLNERDIQIRDLEQQLQASQAEIAARDERIAELEQERGQVIAGIADAGKSFAKERDDMVGLYRARVRELEAALWKHGLHGPKCAAFPATSEEQIERDCDCRLRQILAAATTEPAADARECEPAPPSEARNAPCCNCIEDYSEHCDCSCHARFGAALQ